VSLCDIGTLPVVSLSVIVRKVGMSKEELGIKRGQLDGATNIAIPNSSLLIPHLLYFPIPPFVSLSSL
jgi:hypothetical protein